MAFMIQRRQMEMEAVNIKKLPQSPESRAILILHD